MIRKCLAVGIILLFVGATIAPAIAQNTEKQSTSRGNWLYVGGSGPRNYTAIQSAINDANDGDTLFVYADLSPYNENIIVNKSIRLLGEDKNTTIIEDSILYGTIVSITVEDVMVEGFTVRQQEGKWATCIDIQANDSCISNTIIDSKNFIGISLAYSGSRIVSNRISGNQIGVMIYGSNHFISENTIKNNDVGVEIVSGSNNLIYHNYFDNFWNDAFNSGGGNNTWSGDFLSGGNYWHDFVGRDEFWGPNQDIYGSDGIFDLPFRIDGDPDSFDYYPLKYPYDSTQLWAKFTPKTHGSTLLIRNFLTTTAFDVHWTLTLQGGKLLCPRQYAGGVKPLVPGETITILPGFFFVGLGMIEINATICAENTPTVTKKIDGFLFLFFFKELKD